MDPNESDYYTDSDASVDIDDLFQFLDHNNSPAHDDEADHSFASNLSLSPIDPEELIHRLQERRQQQDNLNGDHRQGQDEDDFAVLEPNYAENEIVQVPARTVHRRCRRRLDFNDGQEPVQGEVPLLVLQQNNNEAIVQGDNNEEEEDAQADENNPAFNEFLNFIMAWEGVENPVPAAQEAPSGEDDSSPASGRSLY